MLLNENKFDYYHQQKGKFSNGVVTSNGSITNHPEEQQATQPFDPTK